MTEPDDPTPDDKPDALGLAREIADAYRGRPPAERRRRRRSRPSPRRGQRDDPVPLADVMGDMVRERGWDERLSTQRIYTDWAGIVGPEVADHSEVVGYTDGVVEIKADSTAWARELQFLAASIVRKLNEELGHGSVLRIDVHGPQAPSWKKGKRTLRNMRGPRDTYG
jgi:predicted nucleic acid-binding Zn ribbon protein